MDKFFRYICCKLDLTIASRLIAFAGVGISVVLMTVLLNDKYLTPENNYDISRKTALALGLDWRHFHENASITAVDDPDGKMVSVIVIFYSTAFLFINLLLFFGSIKCDWCCALPWLLCELVGCISKFGALVYHWNCEPFHMSDIFIAGSVIYIVITIWWWIVVFSAQKMWRCSKQLDLELELKSVQSVTPTKLQEFFNEHQNPRDSVTADSPGPYENNSQYSLI